MAKKIKTQAVKDRVQAISDNAKVRPLTARQKRLQKIFGSFK